MIRPFDAEQADAHVVSMSLFADVIAQIDAFQSVRQTQVTSPIGATLQVSVITPERNTPSFYGVNEALSLLEAVQKTCRSDEALSTDIAYFQRRILQYRRR